jgi:diguanylate cyclase (GGDEF)-like protein
MKRVDEWLERFERLPVFVQTSLVVIVAAIGADVLTAIFYAIFFFDRLLLDLFLTTVIVGLVSYPLGYIFIRQNVRLTRMTEELHRAATIDDLTDLANRKTFLLEARGVIERNTSEMGAGVLLFIDADHFKSLNDRFGHATGDAVLRELGSVIRSSVTKGDIAGRFGGEEFVVFLVGANYDKARRICDRISSKARAIANVLGLKNTSITVSIGVAAHQSGDQLDVVLRAADESLYAAKAQGRDRAIYSHRDSIAA